MNNTYFITGIGTGIGKTIVSAILTQKLASDYWKPIQSGDLEQSDSLSIKDLISNTKTVIHPEQYRLSQPLSPHLSARLDGIEIKTQDLKLPATKNQLIIEGAGGLMVPINEKELILDLIPVLNAKLIIVSQNYLGSINHTLLSLEVLKSRNIQVQGIIFNGEANKESESYIANYTGIPILGNIPKLARLDKKSIAEAGKFIQLSK
ncbi:dethiobiotin synthase [Pedobacter sp. N36a]|uniref:dethiobiotin synthase n=1 Tax=Pedobacter sp. N36a TaxID=2767996 RepID=UPI001657071B|nr:dethiobiotin synthase [Pedobacter sp. N36a]MBC8986520.1 dethiobiotin synthase [Pedobacter sp. N36a]